MGAEVSVIGEYALYALYFLLVLSIVAFIYILYKKQLSVDLFDSIDDKDKKRHYQIDDSLIHQNKTPHHYDVVNIETDKISDDNSEGVTTLERPKEDEVLQNVDEVSCLPIYKNDIPTIDEVKPDFFEYFKGQKLLIVEDNKINQKILLNVLRNINTPIEVADNGEEALTKVLEEKQEFDMILMDISMPVMDGINATKALRSDSICNDIPIVTVTAFTSGLEIGQMFEVGANAFLTKPLDIHKLFTVMLLFLDNTKSDLSIEKEFDILGINLDQITNDMHANRNDIKEAIEEFIDKFGIFEYKIPMWIDDNDFAKVIRSLDELDMILDLIGAIDMQQFIESMKVSLNKTEDIEYYKVLFRAKYKALLNTYKKYLNSF